MCAAFSENLNLHTYGPVKNVSWHFNCIQVHLGPSITLHIHTTSRHFENLIHNLSPTNITLPTEKQIHTSKELKPMFEPSFLAKVGQHSIMPSFEELIRVVYWGQFLVLTPTCCSHLLNPRFL